MTAALSPTWLTPPYRSRNARIDFFRGLALLFIFWDHLPGNPLGLVTIRNFGLSDAAEIFVFLAGYSAACAWGRLLRNKGYWTAAKRILRRTFTLYGTYLFLTMALLVVGLILQALPQPEGHTAGWHLLDLHQNHSAVPSHILTLRYSLPLLDPLPLYIVLLLVMTVMLPLAVYRPLAFLALSAGLYTASLVFGLSLPGTENKDLFFNPMGWQFLFCLGGLCALHGPRFLPDPDSTCVRHIALVILGLGCLLAWSWKHPDLHDAIMPRFLAEWLYPINKSLPDPLRLVHFLALAWTATTTLPPDGTWLRHPLAIQLGKMGQHSLPVFGTGVIITPILDSMARMAGGGPFPCIVACLAGTAVLLGLAKILEKKKEAPLPPVLEVTVKAR